MLTQREVSNFKSKLLALYKSHLDTITSIPEIKEKDSEAVESISSKLVEGSAPAAAEAQKLKLRCRISSGFAGKSEKQ